MKHIQLISALLVMGLILAGCVGSPAPAAAPAEAEVSSEAAEPAAAPAEEAATPPGLDFGPVFHIQAGQMKLIGGHGDNFVYNGEDVRAGEGTAEMHLDADTDTGIVVSTFTVPRFNPSKDIDLENATVTMIFPIFGAPPDAGMPEYWEGGISDNVLLHGNSGSEAPVLPVVRTSVASWGPVLIYVNGELIDGGETFMGKPNPLGAMFGHMMITDIVRDPETQQVYNEDGSGFYVPKDPGNGSVTADEITLLHLVAHSEAEDPDNFPGFDFFIHTTFEVTSEAEAQSIPDLTFEKLAAMSEDELAQTIKSFMP